MGLQRTGARRGTALAWLILLGSANAPAQLRARALAYPGVDADGCVLTLPAALRTMAAQAGIIFVGTVTSVRRVADPTTSAVEITFAVEQPVRGVAGPTYTLREWPGLLPPGQRPFTLGQRRLMLLHTPAATGFSSPVGGFEGAIPIVGAGTRVRPAGTLTADPVDMLDLRWIAAKLTHPLLYAGTATEPSSQRLRSSPETAAERLPGTLHGTLRSPGPVPIATDPTVTNELPLASVLAMLTAWAALDSHAR